MTEAFQICTKDTIHPSHWHEGQWKNPSKPKMGIKTKEKGLVLPACLERLVLEDWALSEETKYHLKGSRLWFNLLGSKSGQNKSYMVLHKNNYQAGPTAASYLPRVLVKVWGQARATPSAGLVCRVSSRPETWRWPSELSVHPAPETSFYGRNNQHQINDGRKEEETYINANRDWQEAHTMIGGCCARHY